MSPLSFGSSSNRSFGITKKRFNVYEDNLKLYYDFRNKNSFEFFYAYNLIEDYPYRSSGTFSGLPDGYLEFDSSDFLIGPSAASNILGSGAATVMFWCNQASFGNDLIGADSGGSLATDWQLSSSRTGFPGSYSYNLVVERPSEGINNVISIASDFSFHPTPTDTWIFYCISFDPVADNIKVNVHVPLTPTTPDDFPYRSTISTITSYVGGGLGSTVPLKLAGNTAASSFVRIGQVLCYDVRLTDDQILQNFQSTRGRYGPYYSA